MNELCQCVWIDQEVCMRVCSHAISTRICYVIDWPNVLLTVHMYVCNVCSESCIRAIHDISSSGFLPGSQLSKPAHAASQTRLIEFDSGGTLAGGQLSLSLSLSIPMYNIYIISYTIMYIYIYIYIHIIHIMYVRNIYIYIMTCHI